MAKGKGDDAKAKKDKKGKKGEDGGKPAKAKRSKGGIRPARLGILAATLIAGPPVYRLVQQGTLDSTTALMKVGIVALGLTIGISWIRGLVVDYQAEVELDKRRKAARAQELLRMVELENAAKAAEAAAAELAQRKAARRAGSGSGSGSGSGVGSGSGAGSASGVGAGAGSAGAPSSSVPAQGGSSNPAAAIPGQATAPRPTQPA